jgi:phosphoglycerate-specific signal transduction histidine kinase
MEYKTVQFDASTNEVIERVSTSDEIKEVKKLQSEIEARREAEEENAQAKLVAQAKLAALGLTTEDLQALGL